MKTIAAIVLSLVACASDEIPDQADAPDALWLCSTSASCEGDTRAELHQICLRPSNLDVLTPGDAAALDWEQVWSAACVADEGLIGSPSSVCFREGSTDPGTFGCSVRCYPQHRECAP